ncbi:hypothetical protein CGLO_17407 [Colletotrichum gloeosporioides Cg-14]|uniref:Uncharacterized protein n=1 Tax=Colletotrichum gloeosporioides (strain Cg-14) TaxID=1237896 RepID=T0L6J5_COLGC|nr:hypothetical protein CGLO_17407 [Colletotrichum gloeosporioides Cg-14]
MGPKLAYYNQDRVRLILGGKIIQILEDSGVPKEILSRVDIYKRQNQSQAMVSPSLSHHATEDIGTESLNTRSQILGNFLLPPSNILCSAPPSVYSGFKSHPSSVVGLHCSTPGTTLSAKTSKNNLLADSNRPNATSSYLEEGYVDSRRQNFYTPTHRGQSITGDYVTGDIDSSKQTCALPDTSFRMTGTSSGSYSATIDPCLLQDRSHGYTSPNTGLGNLHMEAFNKTTPSPFATQSNPKLRVVSPEDRNTLGEVYRLEQNWQEASNLWVPGQASTTQAEAQLSLETLSNLPDNSDFGNFDSYTSDHFRNL